MNTSAPQDPLGIRGTLIQDKYLVGEVVGEGGFSIVYKAEHTIWGQPVALKCFKVLANAPPEQRDQLLSGFLQEGKLMTALSSRSAAIVQARDVGTFTTEDGTWVPFMVLEWLDGRPLDLILYDEAAKGLSPRSLHEIMALLEPAAVALDLVHHRHIAHRDIKPANIFVLGDPRGPGAHVKVLDFGIAKVMAEHAQHATALAQTGKEITAFTPNYGAPEQFSRQHGATGPWTDVFAMALVLVEMMRGIPALEGDDFVQLSVASRDPLARPTPRRFGLAVPDAVEAVFAKALAISPAERFPTMGAFWAALYASVFPDLPTWAGATTGGYGPRSVVGAAPPQAFAPSGPVFGVPSGMPSPALTPPGATSPGQPQFPFAQTPPSVRQPMSFGAPMMGPASAPRPMPPPTDSSFMATALAPVRPRSKAKAALVGAGILGMLVVGAAGAYVALGGARPPAPAALAAAPLPSASAAPAASAPPARRTECPQGMALVSGGKFFMGSDDTAFPLWQPAHKVTLDTFCMDVHEVTAGDYKACSDQGECKRPPAVPDYPKSEGTSDEQHEKNKAAYAELCNFGQAGRESHPINCVPWDLADAYCKVQKKRLPTEAEWEYAARGSDGRKFPWGDDPGDSKHMNACGHECNRWEKAHGLKLSTTMYDSDDGFPGTAPVGSFPAGRTKFGLDDMIGNVWEWTQDWFETYKPDEVVNPKGAPAGDRKAIRGGGFNGGVQLWLNPAFRFHQVATASAPGIGFRCAADL